MSRTHRARLGPGLAAVGIAALACTAPSVASAQSSAEAPEPYRPTSHVASTGVQVGARLGYAAGAGSVYSGLGVADASVGTLPVIADLGWRALPELYVGAYGQFAPVMLRENPQSCPQGFSCAAQNWRIGLQVDYHFLPRTRLDPYVGIGGGYEILRTHVSGTTTIPLPQGPAPGQVDSTVVDRGWEFANLTLGFDWRASKAIGVGPFATATLARYNVREGDRTVTVAGNVVPSAQEPIDHATHAQFLFGIRGTFNPSGD